MISVRQIRVVLSVDTNKYDLQEELEPHEGEGLEDFLKRVAEKLREMMPE